MTACTWWRAGPRRRPAWARSSSPGTCCSGRTTCRTRTRRARETPTPQPPPPQAGEGEQAARSPLPRARGRGRGWGNLAPGQAVTVEGLRIVYREEGPRDAPPVVVLHGWGASIAAVATIQASLRGTHRTIALDLPGFGASDPPPVPWGAQEYAAHLRAFLKQLGVARASFVGHSHGGRVAIVLAATHPEMVDKLVLVDSAGIRPKRSAGYYARVYSYKASRRLLALPALAGPLGAPLRRQFETRAGSDDYRQAGSMRGTLVRVVNEDWRHLLPKIQAPTLLIWGERDDATPLSDGQLMERLIPDAGLVVFPAPATSPTPTTWTASRGWSDTFFRGQDEGAEAEAARRGDLREPIGRARSVGHLGDPGDGRHGPASLRAAAHLHHQGRPLDHRPGAPAGGQLQGPAGAPEPLSAGLPAAGAVRQSAVHGGAGAARLEADARHGGGRGLPGGARDVRGGRHPPGAAGAGGGAVRRRRGGRLGRGHGQDRDEGGVPGAGAAGGELPLVHPQALAERRRRRSPPRSSGRCGTRSS